MKWVTCARTEWIHMFVITGCPHADYTCRRAGRAELDAFVQRTFSSVCGGENVIWFRNWGALKSVHAVEHFHVMLFDPPGEFVREVTGGDVSLAEKVERGLVSL